MDQDELNRDMIEHLRATASQIENGEIDVVSYKQTTEEDDFIGFAVVVEPKGQEDE